MDKIENEKILLEKQIKELLVLTKDCSFMGTDVELKAHVAEFATTTEKMRQEEEETVLKQINILQTKLKEINANKSKLMAEMGVQENKYKIYGENRSKLFEYLRRSALLIEETIEGNLLKIFYI